VAGFASGRRVTVVLRARQLAPATLIGALGAVAMFVRLFVPVPVGLANNGDAARMMCQFGADAEAAPQSAAQWYFVRFWYPQIPPDPGCGSYRTSQLLQLRATSWLHKLFGLPGVIDMREVMVEDCVLVGLALGVLGWLLRDLRLWARLLILAGTFLILADATFADYAASPYSESAALIGVLAVAIAGVAVIAGPRRRLAFLVLCAGAVLAVAAKTEMVTLAVPLALLIGSRKVEWGRLRGRIGARIIPGLGVIAVLASAIWVTGQEAPHFELVDVGNEITMTIMPESSDPAAVATELGLPASFGKYSGSNWWSPQPIENDPQFAAYPHVFTRDNLAHYFVAHPESALRVGAGGASFYLAFRVDYLGTYGVDSGRPSGGQECRFCLLPTVSHALAGTGIAGLLGYWLLCLVGAGFLARRSAPNTRRRGFALVSITLVGVAIIQYVTAVFGDGNEVTKHLVVALFAASLAPLWLLAGALCRRPIPVEPAAEAAELTEAIPVSPGQ
jgi:hypothetical protein